MCRRVLARRVYLFGKHFIGGRMLVPAHLRQGAGRPRSDISLRIVYALDAREIAGYVRPSDCDQAAPGIVERQDLCGSVVADQRIGMIADDVW